MQRVAAANLQLPEVVVDYAHTPDALDKTLAALRPLAAARGGKLWCVFGCGGDRDTTKRPMMGAIAQQLADVVLVTSDNPRSEPAQSIVDQIVAGMRAAPAPIVQVDRRLAIEQAIAQAAPQDVLLLAGKGHESTQEIAGVKHPFSDVLVARAALRQRGATC
jgi:UDP-N-acetylmuramoyl-L-alanyl-D-glutamate--2,6-diaminopimelate ligase